MSHRAQTVIVSLLAIALLAWFLRDANLRAVWAHVRRANIELLLAGLAFVVLTYWARAVRWQYLLAPLGPVRFRTAFRTSVIGFAALGLLPARAGDILRPYLLARHEGLSAPSVFATVILERVLDLVAVLALLATYVWLFAEESLPADWAGPIQASALVFSIAALVLLTVMWLLATHPERIGILVAGMARLLPARTAQRLGDLAQTFSAGFAGARHPKILLLGLVWSFPLWLAIAGEAWAVTRAFDIDMSFAGSFLLTAFLVIGVAVPTPGAVGSYHEMYRLAVTTFFDAGNDEAVAAAIVVHAISFVPVVLVGILFMAQDGLSVGGLQRLAGEAREQEMPQSNEVPILRSPRR